MKKLKILIVTNLTNETDEDIILGREFINDGHNVTFSYLDFDEKLENIYDVIIRRNTWWKDGTKMFEYYKNDIEFSKRVLSRNLCTINFNGKFDATNKDYLVDFFKKGYSVIPTVNNVDDIDLLGQHEKYLIKPIKGYDGLYQKKVSYDEIKENYQSGDIVQPVIKFKSEVQFYFLKNKFFYALEFAPSKIPVMPTPMFYEYTEEDLETAKMFADLNDDFIGIQRIDFVKDMTDKLLLLEIEDHSPVFDFKHLPKELYQQFIKEYKEMVYNHVDKFEQ
ncbi:MAG: hypothetical protein FWC68_05040 [Oscillospiraceae bacterium]|nr:hypothetical protein [Oscillospiraceae bacterium]